MSFLKDVFGPSKEEIWRQVASDIGGEYIDGGFWRKDVLHYQAGQWPMMLDTFSKRHGDSSRTYTRLRAPFVNKDGLWFEIYREGIFSSIARYFGMQDIVIGVPLFDDNFIIKGNDEYKVRRLFQSEELQRLLHQQNSIKFSIQDDQDRWFAKPFPGGVNVLYFESAGVVKETQRLRALFDLFTITLERLVQMDSAYEDDPNIQLD